MATSLHNTLLDAVVARLVDVCITQIDSEDDTRAGVAREGPLQQDPTSGRINLLVYPGDPDDDDWVDSLRTYYVNADMGVPAGMPTFEIGGGAMYWRVYTVEFSIFLAGDSFDEARTTAHVVKSRVEQALRTMSLPSGYDDFNEIAVGPRVIQTSQMLPGGGPGNYNWRGKIHYAIGTETAD